MKEQIKEYNLDLQRLFVEFLAQDKDLFSRVNGIIDSSYFDRELRKGVEFIQEHASGYSALPTLEQIKATTGLELQKLKDVDNRRIFEKDDDVGVIFESILKIQEILNEFTVKKFK